MIAGAPAAGKGTQCVKIVEKVSYLLSMDSYSLQERFFEIIT